VVAVDLLGFFFFGRKAKEVFVASKLDRTMFETSRAAEYFDTKELQAQTGQPEEMFPAVALKELVDNGLDACETAGVVPKIDIHVKRRGEMIHIAVHDNANGIAPRTIEQILNFDTRTSDKAVYRSPTRGAQGNALKTVIGLPQALDSKEPIVIESSGVRHSIKAWIDPAEELRIEHDQGKTDVVGTRISLALPYPNKEFSPDYWAKGFSLFNPHAFVRIRDFGENKHVRSPDPEMSEIDNSYKLTASFHNGWRKFLPTDLTSPYWYSPESLERLIFSHIGDNRRGGRDLTLREFLTQFRGLSGTAKSKQVCDQFTAINRLTEFEENQDLIGTLLEQMREKTKPPTTKVLGIVGEAHFRACFESWYTVHPKAFWYKKVVGKDPNKPYVFEVALAVIGNGENKDSFFSGINFSPTYEDPLRGTALHHDPKDVHGYGIKGFLQAAYATDQPIAIATHLIDPNPEFLDRGKSQLKI